MAEENVATSGIYAGPPSATSDSPITGGLVGPQPTVSVKDFLDLTDKVYSLKDPVPFKLADDSDWKALVAEFKTLADKVTALNVKVTALEAKPAAVAHVSTPSPELSDVSALRVRAIEDRLALFNSRSGQHI